MSLSKEDREFLEAIKAGLQISYGAKTGDIRNLIRIVEGLRKETHGLEYEIRVLKNGNNSPDEMYQEIQRYRKENDRLRSALKDIQCVNVSVEQAAFRMKDIAEKALSVEDCKGASPSF